ncbi:MAG: hypothetical protein EpisKO_15640 [Epibacterium sp.]
MTQDSDALQADFENEEVIAPMDDGPPPQKPRGPIGKSGAGAGRAGRGGKQGSGKPSSILPEGFPVQPLGMSAGKYYFLNARGERIDLTAGALSQRANLVSLLAGSTTPKRHLKDIAPPDARKDTDFNPANAADKLMQACAEMPLYDPSKPVRHFGTWRGGSVHPVVHLGETVETSSEEEVVGRMIGSDLYPAVPTLGLPDGVAATAEEMNIIRMALRDGWNWVSPDAVDLVIGWIGQAALGQYPRWRSHMWIRGRSGAGKTTLLEVISSLLGGMSTGVKSSGSSASIRQTTNRMAIARIFDEAEGTGTGDIEDVIALFRLMSDAHGARVERGTSDHTGIRFEIYGAGLLGSIIPGSMTPQDRSRFVVVPLKVREKSSDPAHDAVELDKLERRAKELGPRVWRRMLSLASQRWDSTFRVYNSLVQSLGAQARAGDTVGALLAGWDLMLFEKPLVDPETNQADPKRMERALAMALPLVEETREAEEEGEGERLLTWIFGAMIHKDHGGMISVSELIQTIQEFQDVKSGEYQNKLLARLGLRVMPGERGQRDLFVANGENPQLNKALANTRWRGGGHRAALDTMPEVAPAPKPVRVDGRPKRGLVVPARFLPGYIKETASNEGEDGI